MENKNFRIGALLFLLLALPLEVSCGNTTKKTTTVKNTKPAANVCGPEHKMGTRKVVWQKHQCEIADTRWVDQSSLSDTGVPLGITNVSHGMLSVTYNNLSNENIYCDDIYCIDVYGIMFMAYGWDVMNYTTGKQGKGEANWHFMANVVRDGGIESRLISQRFDGTCSPFCEEKDYNNSYQFMPVDNVKFDCSWSLSELEPEGKVWCLVKKVKAGEQMEYWTVMNGPYFSLNYIGVGKRAIDHIYYKSFDAQVSDFKVTIFETK